MGEVEDAKGFMPVAFAMLGVSTTRSRMKRALVLGVRIPVVLVPWFMLCMVWFIPRSSFLSNLCGLLAGEAYGLGYCFCLDIPESVVSKLDRMFPFSLLRRIPGLKYIPGSLAERRASESSKINPVPGSYPTQSYYCSSPPALPAFQMQHPSIQSQGFQPSCALGYSHALTHEGSQGSCAPGYSPTSSPYQTRGAFGDCYIQTHTGASPGQCCRPAESSPHQRSLIVMGDAGMQPTVSTSENLSPQDSLFSMTDVFLISLITGLFTYWFFFRKKKEEVPELPKIQPVTSPERDSSFIEKMKKTGRNIVVFYGSQTGTAEEFANRLSKDAHRYGLRGMAADPEEYDLSDLSRLSEIDKSLAVFCMATYGEGDPTDNAQDFYDWLQETDADLSGLRFAVFGLGNKTYEHFNAMGKYVDKRLQELGAQRIFELGLGDDDGNLEEDFITWREQFWPAVCEHFGVEATGEESSIRQYELVVHTDMNMSKVYTGEMGRLKSYENQKPPFDAKNPFLASVTMNRKLNEGGERHLMHLELDISDSKIRYESGDHVAVYPANDSLLVNQIGEILHTDLDTIMSLNNLDEESNKKHPFPCPTSYRTALTYYLDITNPPRTNVLYELAQYATDTGEQEQLRKMASSAAEGKALYLSWVVEARRNILAILQDMPSLQPPIDHLCELLPRLQARYYSIASSSKVHPNAIHICAVTVEYETKTGRLNKGVATNWLKNMVPDENRSKSLVPMYVRKSQFRLPFKPGTPVIMIGPGTGIAPFIGFIQERAWLKQQGKDVGETVLYYGCRHEHEDYLYREELARFHQDGLLTQLNVAFSRDQAEKVYVQHLLRKNKENVWKLVNEGNAHIYVCGDARNMARDVQNTFYEIVAEFGNMSQPQAVDYVKKLMTKGRYSLDVWS
ncbi:NADPH--cytochrome P450 reductase isoform X2 [Apteryx rowi]|uniref:NADPH--cytochrome P450 reductase isoform X2 n=2 Tax=Apteryx rowi TaxID=308060 RepID=UPI000E1C6620|nr:NADPH--cytochrome P450 reductase isoform X2 [Apteryx rowi]